MNSSIEDSPITYRASDGRQFVTAVATGGGIGTATTEVTGDPSSPSLCPKNNTIHFTGLRHASHLSSPPPAFSCLTLAAAAQTPPRGAGRRAGRQVAAGRGPRPGDADLHQMPRSPTSRPTRTLDAAGLERTGQPDGGQRRPGQRCRFRPDHRLSDQGVPGKITHRKSPHGRPPSRPSNFLGSARAPKKVGWAGQARPWRIGIQPSFAAKSASVASSTAPGCITPLTMKVGVPSMPGLLGQIVAGVDRLRRSRDPSCRP